MRLLIVIPCLNEAASIGKVLDSIPRSLTGVQTIDHLVIDDGSTDSTADVAQEHGAKVVSHGRNLGVGEALKTSLDFAIENKYDLMVNMDGDGQFDANDIAKLVEPIVAGSADFTTASRFVGQSHPEGIPWIKLWGNRRMASLVSSLAGQRFADVSCGFRAYSQKALLNLNLIGKFTYTQESILDLAFKNLRIAEIPVTVKYFADRRSRVAGSIAKYAWNTLQIIFRSYRDYRPLKFFWSIGGFFAMFGGGMLSVMLVRFFLTGTFSPYISVGALGGFLLSLGILFFLVGLVTDMLDRLRINQERILFYLKRRDH